METRLKALIVDDSELSRCMTGTIIGKVFSFDEAENGKDGVAKHRKAVESGTPYDIIFMDIVMPEMDGKEAVRRIREYETSQNLETKPIIMISASEMLGDIEGLVSGLFRKPTSKELMNELLQNIFNVTISPI